MSMTEFNVWLDTVFVVLYGAVLLFLAFHFFMGIVKGRARTKFIEKKWPEHDHAPTVGPKLLHATHMIMMVVLGFTGMYIRFPYFQGGRVAMRYVHYFAMIVVCIILVTRVWYAFYSKTRDWREFAVTREDLASTLGVLAYYGYFSNKKPHVAKYNVLQKMSYLLFLVMMVLMAITGFSLVTTPLLFGTSPRDWIVGWWLGSLVGSVDLAGWYARSLHYILNWAFIIMTTIHVYLSATEDIPCTLDFFGLKPLVLTGGHGHDDALSAETPVPPGDEVLPPSLVPGS
ncbi:MAG: cytochrome b/b6 domain-containing protein [Actinomycetota bacterium]|jgi:Ni,Fe-hydrogenase I cytochrome b subunit|nr:cytochrome b/b6 domain-containing protein [Actinomycetota bacterium]